MPCAEHVAEGEAEGAVRGKAAALEPEMSQASEGQGACQGGGAPVRRAPAVSGPWVCRHGSKQSSSRRQRGRDVEGV